MIKEVLFPKLSAKTNDGVIVKWNKKVGQEVELDEVLYEVETEKTIIEVESPLAGVLKEIKAEEGDTVKVDQVIAEMEVD
ncbi:hypothetical protein BG261_07990 [Floricoccus tropicus]|uniref:Lipoyl-binding domain-containing protein n=2 Tax=Floricoccus TaxID=1930830 RepID=A0A1E8GIY7_9LACT|nr:MULTISPECIES: biotin/lipoyl-containing protein [Floricoccus]OFI46371.1 hypothetical protein BG262_04975 [Floricoccus penangensis]OFI48214.1 hypothetical protein BG261_07990 [Floricoccus tropicus]URZ87099.1 biotin/lipoyl-binding protein [Floricoccus penangensis]